MLLQIDMLPKMSPTQLVRVELHNQTPNNNINLSIVAIIATKQLPQKLTNISLSAPLCNLKLIVSILFITYL